MTRLGFSSSLLAVTVLTAVFARPAHAFSDTYLSATGSGIVCSREAPCTNITMASFAAHGGGGLAIVHCLDSGEFGSATILFSVTIDCGGTNARVTGLTITANSLMDVVTIRNLSIDGLSFGPPGTGILYRFAKSVHLENVAIRGFTTACISVEATANAELTVKNSTLENCGNAGIRTVTTTGNTVVGDIHNVRISKAGNGINAQNGSRLSVRDCEITFANPGINQSGLEGGGSVVLVEGSTLAFNGTAGLQSAGGGTITAFNNVISGNPLMFNLNGGQIFTGGDNASMATDAVGATSGMAARHSFRGSTVRALPQASQ